MHTSYPGVRATKESLAYIYGDCPRDLAYTVSLVTRQEKGTAALVHELFKKHDVIETILHEAQLANEDVVNHVLMFRTPVAIMKRFSAAGDGESGVGFQVRFRSPVWCGKYVCCPRGRVPGSGSA